MEEPIHTPAAVPGTGTRGPSGAEAEHGTGKALAACSRPSDTGTTPAAGAEKPAAPRRDGEGGSPARGGQQAQHRRRVSPAGAVEAAHMRSTTGRPAGPRGGRCHAHLEIQRRCQHAGCERRALCSFPTKNPEASCVYANHNPLRGSCIYKLRHVEIKGDTI